MGFPLQLPLLFLEKASKLLLVHTFGRKISENSGPGWFANINRFFYNNFRKTTIFEINI